MSARRRAVVTGGSRGIGRAAALALAERGWRVTLVARNEQELTRVSRELAGHGHDVLPFDVADEAAWHLAAPTLEDVQGLVCAAAMLDPVGPIGTYTVGEFRRTLEVNVIGTLLAIMTCLPGLRASEGAIVTFGGGGATAALRRFDAYATSKAAIVRLTENLAAELVEDRVRVNCVAPGFVATEIHKSTLAAGPELAGADYYERTRTELERGGVPPSEAAALVCLLLEDEPDAAFTGKLVSAQWDAWRDADFRRRLRDESHLGTLRRIDDVLFAANGEPTNT